MPWKTVNKPIDDQNVEISVLILCRNLNDCDTPQIFKLNHKYKFEKYARVFYQ